jgi:hypothetical protein
MDPTVETRTGGAPWFILEPPFNSFVGLARHLTLAGLAGVLTGILVGGVGGRLFMRLADAAAPALAQGRRTEAGFTVGEVTVGGSLGLVIFIGLFTGVVGAVLFVVFSPWLSWAGQWRGALFGVVLLAIGSATSDVMNPDNIDFRILENSVLLTALIFVLFIAFGIGVDGAFKFLDQRMPRVGEGANAVKAPYIVFALIGVLLFLSVLPIFFTESSCSCEPPIVASGAMVLSGIGTLVWWASGLISALPSQTRLVAALLGYLGLAGVLLFGLIRAVSDAIEIIA